MEKKEEITVFGLKSEFSRMKFALERRSTSVKPEFKLSSKMLLVKFLEKWGMSFQESGRLSISCEMYIDAYLSFDADYGQIEGLKTLRSHL